MKIDALHMNTVQPVSYDPTRVNTVKEQDPAAEEQKKAEEARQERQEEAAAVNASVYGDVLARDQDGDTVAAQKQSLEALEDGLVFAKDNADEAAAQRTQPEEDVALPQPAQEAVAAQDAAKAQEADKKEETDPLKQQQAAVNNPLEKEKTAAEKLAEEEAKKDQAADAQQSLTGVSANQLETMYLQGKISRYQYDQEIGRRDALMEKEEKPVGQVEEEEDEAEEKKPNAERVQEEINANKSFNQEMGRLNNAVVAEDVFADAMRTANENDRVDLMTKVFDTN